jgi:hypothetical protein
MIINADILRKETVALLRKIDAELAEAEEQKANEADRLGSSRYGDELPIRLATLYQAKAMAYNTLVTLQQK